MDKAGEFQRLVEIIDVLRSPQGCSWDREQSHLSIRDSLLEECYEVLEAIDTLNMNDLQEELGDLLMQVVFHARIAEENGDFTIKEVIESVVTKLVRRHPHVFSISSVADSEEILRQWEEIKKEERPEGVSMLDGVPTTMPALAYSQELQSRAARVGFDWDGDDGIMDKLAEEIGELRRAKNDEEKEEELGDIFFTVVNYARRQGIDAESSLRSAGRKFQERFQAMEAYCSDHGLVFSNLTLTQQNELWERVKAEKTN